MNSFKFNWYLATQDIDTLIRSVTQVKDYTKPMKQLKTHLWDNWSMAPHNLWETYNTPEGQVVVDVTLGLAMPALAIGRRANKIIEITRHLSEYVDSGNDLI